MQRLNNEVTVFLDGLNHPFRKEIEKIRGIILNTDNGINENIKWNGPNYVHQEEDKITMRIMPPKQVQLIFHRGAKKKEQLSGKIISNPPKFLIWKENDRAIASFKSLDEIIEKESDLVRIITEWINY